MQENDKLRSSCGWILGAIWDGAHRCHQFEHVPGFLILFSSTATKEVWMFPVGSHSLF